MKSKAYYKDTPEYGHYYLDLLESDDLLLELEKSKTLTLELIDSIPPALEHHAYQDGKWTVNEVLRHIIDMERVFAYRAFRFSRFDRTALSGVEENDYIDQVKQLDLKLADLREEYLAVRGATTTIYRNITPEMLDYRGTANEQTYTARTLGFGIAGHNIHHCTVIRSRYLNGN